MNSEIPTVRVTPNKWRNFVGLTDYSCRKIGVPINSIVTVHNCSDRGFVYVREGYNSYSSTEILVDCNPSNIEGF